MTDLQLRAATGEELAQFFKVIFRAFGEGVTEEQLEAERLVAEPERTLAAYDGERIVATAGAFSFDLAVPGARVPAAGVTYVGVEPTHRRRGLLSSLMNRQLADVHGRGEPVAVLWASESAIYERFGYGLASRRLSVEVDRIEARMRSDAAGAGVELDLVDDPAARVAALAAVEAETAHRPGTFRRDERWLRSLLVDLESQRGGFSPLQCVVAREDGRIAGYALYSTKAGVIRPYILSDGEVEVRAQAALTPTADAALTRLLMSVDLMRRVRWRNLPLDAALPLWLTDPRQARSTVLDALHLRIVDIATALSGRRYVSPVDLVLEVDDDRCPWNTGRWHLRADTGGGECRRTEEPARVRITPAALGAAYLGGTSIRTLADTGRVQGDDASLRALSLAFSWDVQPWCPVVF